MALLSWSHIFMCFFLPMPACIPRRTHLAVSLPFRMASPSPPRSSDQVPDLKAELKGRGLRVSGKKAELLARLEEALQQPTV